MKRSVRLWRMSFFINPFLIGLNTAQITSRKIFQPDMQLSSKLKLEIIGSIQRYMRLFSFPLSTSVKLLNSVHNCMFDAIKPCVRKENYGKNQSNRNVFAYA